MVDFEWFPGMAKVQKQKSIRSLHDAAGAIGVTPLLEISSKSEDDRGIRLSAFNLKITTRKHRRVFSVEAAFQGSKVFERGGPYIDLLDMTPEKGVGESKRDIRLRESGNLIGFSFLGLEFPLKPRTLFYDWLYINALNQNQELADYLPGFNAFTDIEFNPKKSLNCQAYSAALYASIRWAGVTEVAISSPEKFAEVLVDEYAHRDALLTTQGALL